MPGGRNFTIYFLRFRESVLVCTHALPDPTALRRQDLRPRSTPMHALPSPDHRAPGGVQPPPVRPGVLSPPSDPEATSSPSPSPTKPRPWAPLDGSTSCLSSFAVGTVLINGARRVVAFRVGFPHAARRPGSHMLTRWPQTMPLRG